MSLFLPAMSDRPEPNPEPLFPRSSVTFVNGRNTLILGTAQVVFAFVSAFLVALDTHDLMLQIVPRYFELVASAIVLAVAFDTEIRLITVVAKC